MWEPSGGLVTTQVTESPSRVPTQQRANNWHFWQVPRWFWCCWLESHSLRTTGLKDLEDIFLLSYLLNPCISDSCGDKNHLRTWLNIQISRPYAKPPNSEAPGEHPKWFLWSEEFKKIHCIKTQGTINEDGVRLEQGMVGRSQAIKDSMQPQKKWVKLKEGMRRDHQGHSFALTPAHWV